jgi:hypothetical protein
MQTGTDTAPASDLIERFNALMDDLIACVTLEALRAAGVPWAVRVLLAPFIRRRIARWSNAFCKLAQGPRAGRGLQSTSVPAIAPAIAPAGDILAERADLDRRRPPVPPSKPVRSESGRRHRADFQHDFEELANVALLPETPGSRTAHLGGRPRAPMNAPMPHANARERSTAPGPFLRGGTRHRGPPSRVAMRSCAMRSCAMRSCGLRREAGAISHAHFVTLSQLITM